MRLVTLARGKGHAAGFLAGLAAVVARVERVLAAKPRVHAEIRAMRPDFEGLPSDRP